MSKLLYFLTLIGLLAWGGCKCNDPSNPDCPDYCDDPTNRDCYNYDPCTAKAPVSAAFHMYERQAGALMPDGWVDYDTDTLIGSAIEFKALEENAEYEWRLGLETIRSRSFVRHSFPEGVPLTVALIVKKIPNTYCFPDDDGIDTVTRTFVNYAGNAYCRENRIITPIKGRYKGVFNTEPGVVKQIEIMPCGMYIIPPYFGPDTVLRPGIAGLPPMDSCTQWSISPYHDTHFGYRQWYYTDDGIFHSQAELDRCKNRAMFILVFQPASTDSVLISYTSNDQGVVKQYEFRGKKTN